MKGLRAATFEPEQDRPARAPQRRAQWASYFLRFFGDVVEGGPVPASFLPVSLDRATHTLEAAFGDGDAENASKDIRYLVRRCTSQIVAYGERRVSDHRALDRLVQKAAKAPDDPDAMDRRASMDAAESKGFLFDWGRREYDAPVPLRRRPASIEEAVRRARPTESTVSLPARITHEAGAFTVEKNVAIRQDLKEVQWLVNPLNWTELGDFFAVTHGADGRKGAVGDDDPWVGVLVEHFHVSWNDVTTHRFRQRFKIDYSVSEDLARTDYLLMYEEDGQIDRNEGFFQVGTLPGFPHWIAGTMRKTVKFRSITLNMLSPAILAMFLDSKTGGFGRFVKVVP